MISQTTLLHATRHHNTKVHLAIPTLTRPTFQSGSRRSPSLGHGCVARPGRPLLHADLLVGHDAKE